MKDIIKILKLLGLYRFNPQWEGYKMVFSDDFRYGINWDKWDHREPWSGIADTHKVNTVWKKQCVLKKNDGLHLVATQGPANTNWCGLISTHRFLSVKYGYISVTAKIPPRGMLYFPAIWMYDKTGWLPEIDIMEAMGADSQSINMTHHWDKDGHQSEGTRWEARYDLSAAFHTYAVEWTPERITWFVDGRERYTTTNAVPQVQLFLICNIQAGVDPAFSHVFTKDEVPQSMIIKKVEVWQK